MCPTRRSKSPVSPNSPGRARLLKAFPEDGAVSLRSPIYSQGMMPSTVQRPVTCVLYERRAIRSVEEEYAISGRSVAISDTSEQSKLVLPSKPSCIGNEYRK